MRLRAAPGVRVLRRYERHSFPARSRHVAPVAWRQPGFEWRRLPRPLAAVPVSDRERREPELRHQTSRRNRGLHAGLPHEGRKRHCIVPRRSATKTRSSAFMGQLVSAAPSHSPPALLREISRSSRLRKYAGRDRIRPAVWPRLTKVNSVGWYHYPCCRPADPLLFL